MEFFVENYKDGSVYYWTGRCWSNLISTAKDYLTKGNANRAAKMLAKYHDGDIQSIAVPLPLFNLSKQFLD